LPIAYLLPIAYCHYVLSVAYFLLPIACCRQRLIITPPATHVVALVALAAEEDAAMALFHFFEVVYKLCLAWQPSAAQAPP
jgi:hypothetical protein